MDGLQEKLRSILDEHTEIMSRYKKKEENLISEINFYGQHRLEEEKRIANLKYNEINMIIYNYSKIIEELKNALNDWNS